MGELGSVLPLWSIIPFVGILLSIAICPLACPRLWHNHYGKIAAAWAFLFAVPFLIFFRGAAAHEILHVFLKDYLPFVVLLWGLFTVSGGIHLRGRFRGTPFGNTMMLLVGTTFASWIGTTGASVLFIRPFLRANHARRRKSHLVIFFIFLVSNIGGSLTPLGDPPLFLGFLHGVPFFWTFMLLPMMGLAVGVLLLMFYAMDRYFYRAEGGPVEEPLPSRTPIEPAGFGIEGGLNFLWLGGVIGAVLMSGIWRSGNALEIFGVPLAAQDLLRDVVILAMGGLSLALTPGETRRANEFTWRPVKEVAFLFAGLFVTIIPAVAILRAGAQGALGFLTAAIVQPRDYFWATGILSSFLDNAPTYLIFFHAALGAGGFTEEQIPSLLVMDAQFVQILKAISAGAVFMGANTYIGNAPNFMVRAIAEENRVVMPSFFGYMVWSGSILIPLFLVLTWIFFA